MYVFLFQIYVNMPFVSTLHVDCQAPQDADLARFNCYMSCSNYVEEGKENLFENVLEKVLEIIAPREEKK